MRYEPPQQGKHYEACFDLCNRSDYFTLQLLYRRVYRIKNTVTLVLCNLQSGFIMTIINKMMNVALIG